MTTAEHTSRDTLEALWENDTVKIVTIIGVAYLAYAVIGLVLGYSITGIANTLSRLTFLIAVYSIVVLALNLQWGYTGLFNIGVAGFMAIGIYTTAMLAKPPDPAGAAQYPGLGLPIPIAVLGGMLAAALAGLVVALPALRLRADYLAIVTIAFAEIVRLLYTASEFAQFTIPFTGVELGTGGGRGLIFNYPDPLEWVFDRSAFGYFVEGMGEVFGFSVTQAQQAAYVLLLIVVVAGIYWVLRRTAQSPFGRVLKAIREDEEAANALGKNTELFKIKAFMLGCALMGLGGILWYFRSAAITPDVFRPHRTFYIWIALIIGGAGSNTGSIVGAGLFVTVLFEGPAYLRRVLQEVITIGDAPTTFVGAVGPILSLEFAPLFGYIFENVLTLQFVVMGVVLVWLMQRRPEGIFGDREEIAAAVPLARRPGEPTADGRGRGGMSEGKSEGGDGPGGDRNE